jgi:outer membrane protein, heavy metal efflux system
VTPSHRPTAPAAGLRRLPRGSARTLVARALAPVAACVVATSLVAAAFAQDAPVRNAPAATPTADQAGLDDLLASVDGRVGVITARLDLDEVERALARTEADPLALRLDLTRARQAVALAEAEARAARFDALAEIAGAWARVRETELQVQLAAAARDLSARALDIARLRAERGSATQLDVEEAATSLEDADKNLAAARDGLALARADLAGLTGHRGPVALQPLERERLERALPDDEVFEAALEGLPSLLQIAHGVELAGIGVELLDPSFASRAQIEQAETQLAQAEAGAAEARRGLALRTRALLNAVVTARETDRIARDALAQAREREAIEVRRFEAGLIAEIALEQARLTTRQAELQAVQAEHGLMLALLDLQAGTLVPLEGWDGR